MAELLLARTLITSTVLYSGQVDVGEQRVFTASPLDEVMVVSITGDPARRLRGHELLARAAGLSAAS